jgi:galactonate dehydratase
MKITHLEILKVPPSWVWVRIHTDDGITGLGEPYLESHPDSVIAEVKRIEPLLIGEDPRRIEYLWSKMYEAIWYYRGGPLTMSAISGIDMALWDIKGKAAGLPVYALLGGPYQERIAIYANAGLEAPYTVEPGRPYREISPHLSSVPSGPPRGLRNSNPDDWAAAAKGWIEWGFKSIKLHFPLGPGLEVSRHVPTVVNIVGAVRAAVGDDIDIAIDMHHLHHNIAMQINDELVPFRLLFVEDPQQLERIDALRMITSRTSIPIAAGAGWMGKWIFHEAVEAGLAVCQPDMTHAGGITECKKIAAIAEAGYAKVALHCPNSIISLAASIHLHASIPNFLVQEQNPVNIHRENGQLAWGVGYLREPFVLDSDGYVPLPAAPGLGVELDEDNFKEIMQMPWRVIRA